MLKEVTIKIGTSGWTYPHWQGVFYPPDWPKSRWLEYYTKHFDTVELNATFYRLPKRFICGVASGAFYYAGCFSA